MVNIASPGGACNCEKEFTIRSQGPSSHNKNSSLLKIASSGGAPRDPSSHNSTLPIVKIASSGRAQNQSFLLLFVPARRDSQYAPRGPHLTTSTPPYCENSAVWRSSPDPFLTITTPPYCEHSVARHGSQSKLFESICTSEKEFTVSSRGGRSSHKKHPSLL